MHVVELDPDHPGFHDPAYRARRDAIAGLAHAYGGGALPRVAYTAEEHGVWRIARRALDGADVASAVREAERAFVLPRARIPQLDWVSRRLEARTGFRLAPVAGLVAPRTFLSALADGVFLSTQYVRHPSRPLYTPEPDVLHELLGHAATLADARFAGLSRAFGVAARAADGATLARIERVYWFTLEFGVVLERGAPRPLGAGLLSSPAERARVAAGGCELLPWDVEVMAATPYATDGFQARLFAAPSFDAMLRDTRAWLSEEGLINPPQDPDDLARLDMWRVTPTLDGAKSGHSH